MHIVFRGVIVSSAVDVNSLNMLDMIGLEILLTISMNCHMLKKKKKKDPRLVEEVQPPSKRVHTLCKM